MSQTYQLTQKILTIAQEKAKKHGLELVIESNFAWFYSKSKNEYKMLHKQYGVAVIVSNFDDVELKCSAIQEPQIRHILTVFEGVLGENPFYFHTISFREDEIVLIDNLEQPWFLSYNKEITTLQKALTRPKSQAEALYNRWFGYKNRPSEEQVLTEFLEVLQSI